MIFYAKCMIRNVMKYHKITLIDYIVMFKVYVGMTFYDCVTVVCMYIQSVYILLLTQYNKTH